MNLEERANGSRIRARRLTRELLEPRKLLAIDLAVDIEGGSAVVFPGDEVAYTITVSNEGDELAEDARLRSDFSESLHSLVWTEGGQEVAKGQIDALINLDPRSHLTYQVTAAGGRAFGGLFTSRVSITASAIQTDADDTNNEVTVTHRSPQRTQIPRHLEDVTICKDETFYVGGDLYFIGWPHRVCEISRACASSGPYAGDLWKTDGTPEGTHRVKQIREVRKGEPGILDAFQNPQFTEYGGILYFVADEGIHGEELWRSDGTQAGTYLVKDINPTIRNELRFCTELDYNQPSQIQNLQVADDRLVFTAKDESGERKSWVSDGTTAGTREQQGLVVRPRDPDPPSSEVTVTFEDDAFYVSSGTPESRRHIADWPQSNGRFRDPDPTDIHVIEDQVIFNSNRGLDESQLLVLRLTVVDELPLFGDLDLDGQVGFQDFLILSANFGKQNASAAEGDIDGDNHVSLADFLILADNFGRRRADNR